VFYSCCAQNDETFVSKAVATLYSACQVRVQCLFACRTVTVSLHHVADTRWRTWCGNRTLHAVSITFSPPRCGMDILEIVPLPSSVMPRGFVFTVQLELRDDLEEYFEKGGGHSLAYGQSCVLLEDVFSSMDATVAGANDGSTTFGHFRFGHAETLMPFVALLVRSRLCLPAAVRETFS
jgi:hypothetical protein